jgi:hypothetical protein
MDDFRRHILAALFGRVDIHLRPFLANGDQCVDAVKQPVVAGDRSVTASAFVRKMTMS